MNCYFVVSIINIFITINIIILVFMNEENLRDYKCKLPLKFALQLACTSLGLTYTQPLLSPLHLIKISFPHSRDMFVSSITLNLLDHHHLHMVLLISVKRNHQHPQHPFWFQSSASTPASSSSVSFLSLQLKRSPTLSLSRSPSSLLLLTGHHLPLSSITIKSPILFLQSASFILAVCASVSLMRPTTFLPPLFLLVPRLLLC